MIGILKYCRRRYTPPSNTVLFIPRGQVSIGRSPNLLINGGFEISDPPDSWTLTGVGAAVARSNTQVHGGTYAAQLTSALIASEIYQDNTGFAKYAGITATLAGFEYATAASLARLSIGDGVATTESSYHSGSSAYEALSVSRRLSASLTRLRARVLNAGILNQVIYADDLDLYVPQIVLPNGQIVYSDQSGIGANGLLTFDGIDDLVILMQSTQWDGTGAFSWMGWITPTGWGGGSGGRFFDNGKLFFRVNNIGVSECLQLASDNVTVSSSAANVIVLNKRQWGGLTRLADGTTNFYTEVNGLPTLSGSANQASGIPVAGGNLIGGNRVAGDRGFAGNPFDNSVLMLRIATMAEMTAHIEATRYS